ncbi:hypothetical protein EOL94_01540 [bacterium]|nr:hypothetical protein [bacterium]
MKKKVTEVKKAIFNLENELEEIKSMKNQILGIVKLFNLTSSLQDSNLVGETISFLKERKRRERTYFEVVEILENFHSFLSKTGRSEHGFNRTKTGEVVTPEKVWLGDIFGLFTKPASYWLAKEESLRKSYRPDVSKNPELPVTDWYLINNYQCETFVKTNVESALNSIKKLKVA